ncbi:hypothetical protein Taro_042703 [Colocasia esculenta]|uniref:Uncharacterized protein n=1 Tax=Colocasia esculenta TaxID=4460 RepID=A0A843WEL1_COLES|nr:hypothetical protein [Colocasia esculenta]
MFTFGSHVLELLCLQSASTNFDLTGQLVWPGSVLLNNFLCKNTDILKGCSVIELGSGVGITGILCRRFCHQVVLTDHNDEVLEILKKNIELQASSVSPYTSGLMAEKLEWGNVDHVSQILQKYPSGFDIILGADICFQQASIPLLFSTVEKLLSIHDGQCRFILAYVSRAKTMDEMVIKEAVKRGMQMREKETKLVRQFQMYNDYFDVNGLLEARLSQFRSAISDLHIERPLNVPLQVDFATLKMPAFKLLPQLHFLLMDSDVDPIIFERVYIKSSILAHLLAESEWLLSSEWCKIQDFEALKKELKAHKLYYLISIDKFLEQASFGTARLYRLSFSVAEYTQFIEDQRQLHIKRQPRNGAFL